jgi:hypothetical protein
LPSAVTNRRLPPSGQVFKGVCIEELLVELAALKIA